MGRLLPTMLASLVASGALLAGASGAAACSWVAPGELSDLGWFEAGTLFANAGYSYGTLSLDESRFLLYNRGLPGAEAVISPDGRYIASAEGSSTPSEDRDHVIDSCRLPEGATQVVDLHRHARLNLSEEPARALAATQDHLLVVPHDGDVLQRYTWGSWHLLSTTDLEPGPGWSMGAVRYMEPMADGSLLMLTFHRDGMAFFHLDTAGDLSMLVRVEHRLAGWTVSPDRPAFAYARWTEGVPYQARVSVVEIRSDGHREVAASVAEVKSAQLARSTGLTWGPGGLAASGHQNVTLWPDPTTPGRSSTVTLEANGTGGAAWSPDGGWLAVGTEEGLAIFDTDLRRLDMRTTPQGDWVDIPMAVETGKSPVEPGREHGATDPIPSLGAVVAALVTVTAVLLPRKEVP